MDFKNLRRLSATNVSINTEFCIRLSFLRIFHIGHVEKNCRRTFSLAVRMVFIKAENERFIAAGSRSRQTRNMKTSRHRLVAYDKNCTNKSAARAARLFFLIPPIKSLICSCSCSRQFSKLPNRSSLR